MARFIASVPRRASPLRRRRSGGRQTQAPNMTPPACALLAWQRASGRRLLRDPLPDPLPMESDCQIASLSSLEARKATFLLALIWMASPVAGLRPMRAARLRTCKMPSPPMRMRSPFLRCLTILPTRPPRMASACFFDSSLSSARLAARFFNVTVVDVVLAAIRSSSMNGSARKAPLTAKQLDDSDAAYHACFAGFTDVFAHPGLSAGAL